MGIRWWVFFSITGQPRERKSSHAACSHLAQIHQERGGGGERGPASLPAAGEIPWAVQVTASGSRAPARPAGLAPSGPLLSSSHPVRPGRSSAPPSQRGPAAPAARADRRGPAPPFPTAPPRLPAPQPPVRAPAGAGPAEPRVPPLPVPAGGTGRGSGSAAGPGGGRARPGEAAAPAGAGPRASRPGGQRSRAWTSSTG